MNMKTYFGRHYDPGGIEPPGPRDAVAPPTGRRCPAGHSDRGGLAAVSKGKPVVSRRFPAAPRNPPSRRSLLRRLGDSDSPSRHPVPGGSPAGNRMAGGGVAELLGTPAVPMPMAWALQGTP
ncbi:hypothetical protein NDU88_000908 [Pleurodeles waltl]|uniref:Uncharacterized protein n=1 Tax=Pleurodeles waltl TaxID=8319 RepID=A0AAV7KR73_PLEWA|nr:hypothetical protein NDU88_000908 [Pleurodeles waltl]